MRNLLTERVITSKPAPLNKFEELFELAVSSLGRWIETIPEGGFKHFTKRHGIYFPKQPLPLGTASFSNENDKHYRAVAFAVAKEASVPFGAHVTYLRGKDDYHWFSFDDKAGVIGREIPHDEIVNLIPSVIVYTRICSF